MVLVKGTHTLYYRRKEQLMKIRIDSIITDDLDELKEKIIDFFFNDLDLEITFEEDYD